MGLIYNKKKAIVFSNFEALERFSNIEFFSKNFLSLYINILILVLIIFAIAGMQVSYITKTSAFSYVIVIDTSSSMKTADIQPNRLEAAKKSAGKFVDSLSSGVEIGIVGFSGVVEIYQDLETSKLKIKSSLDSIEFSSIEGTNVINAVKTADDLMHDRKMKSIILISDGQLNKGDIADIIDYTKNNNIVINTIAAGTIEGGITEFGTISKINEDTLKSLAFSTNGRYFRGDNINNLDQSFQNILAKIEKEVTIDLSLYLLIAALVLFLLNWTLYNFRFKIFP